jgi:BspA type Leucine rich repeat region (6 copies)
VFAECDSLTAIMVDTLNPAYRSADGVLFDKNEQMLIAYPPGRAGSYAVPNGVTNVGPYAFYDCRVLTNLTLPASMSRIGVQAFEGFLGLGHMAIPDGVGTVGTYAFGGCAQLASITIGKGVTNLEDTVFGVCTNLRAIYFKGNAPHLANDAFSGAYPFVYYLPGTTGWGPTFGGLPAVLWNPQMLSFDSGFGVQDSGFGFNISGTAGIPIVVEASTNLATLAWLPLQTCTLTNALVHFSDPQWRNYPGRLYRIRSP